MKAVEAKQAGSSAHQEVDDLDTPSDLAKAAKVTPPTVMDWFKRGIIPAEIAIGRVYRFNRAKCLAALAAHSKQEAAAGVRGGK